MQLWAPTRSNWQHIQKLWLELAAMLPAYSPWWRSKKLTNTKLLNYWHNRGRWLHALDKWSLNGFEIWEGFWYILDIHFKKAREKQNWRLYPSLGSKSRFLMWIQLLKQHNFFSLDYFWTMIVYRVCQFTQKYFRIMVNLN